MTTVTKAVGNTANLSAEEQEKRQKIAAQQEKIARQTLDIGRKEAIEGQATVVGERFQKLATLMQSSYIKPDVQWEIMDEAKQIELQACVKRVDELFENAIDAAKKGQDVVRDTALKRSRTIFARAMQLGADERFREIVLKRLDVVQQTSIRGSSEKAKIDVKQWHEAAGIDDSPGGRERRRHHRFTDPQLEVHIDGVGYETVNWSIGGLLLNAPLPYGKGKTIRLRLHNPESPAFYADVCEVVSNDPNSRKVALKFRAADNATLQIIRELKIDGREPR
ncbi:MAG: hypothetical protein EAZ99_07775 [Alphaproteobacteria bacterium]|nr:hypothetical protein [Alphaproteobacteria bacterium]TAD90109.1 MAG: hypothetical protein EAZ99_07775 [Alphaproteobacteria bacterium]